MRKMASLHKITERLDGVGSIKSVYQNQFYFHFFRDQTFDENTGVLAGKNIIPRLGQSCQIRG